MYQHRVSRRLYARILNRVVADFLLPLSILLTDLAKTESGENGPMEHFAISLSQPCIHVVAVSTPHSIPICPNYSAISGDIRGASKIPFTVLGVIALASGLLERKNAWQFIPRAVTALQPTAYAIALVGYGITSWFGLLFTTSSLLSLLRSVCYIWRSKKLNRQQGSDSESPVNEQRLPKCRFRIPLRMLCLLIGNYAVCSLPMTLYYLLTVVIGHEEYYKWKVCGLLRNSPAMLPAMAVLRGSLLLRIVVDVGIGFAATFSGV